jgi:hypothetical protein
VCTCVCLVAPAGDLETLTLGSFEPDFIRPAPPVLEVADTEVVWLNPDYAPKLLWDLAMCQVGGRGGRRAPPPQVEAGRWC